MGATHREQLNIPVSLRHGLIAKQLAIFEHTTVPQLLRPVLEEYLDQRIQANEDLATVVRAMEQAWDTEDQSKASVTPLADRAKDRRPSTEP
jgi:hypothetical protein